MDRRIALSLCSVLLGGCATANRMSSPAPYADAVQAPAPEPKPLDRSLFAPRGSSELRETDIAQILDAPIELKLPARVGVAALERPFQPGAPETLDVGLAATKALSGALEETKLVSLASEVATELPTGGGVEGLRELAARYRAPYLLLYTERFEDRSHANGWAALWLTLLGGLLTPSTTVQGVGVLEASMLDVRTGTILFTVQEHVSFQELHLPLGAESAFRDLRRKTADDAAKRLAERVVEKLQRVARRAEVTAPPAPAVPAA